MITHKQYLQICEILAEASYCNRSKVGAIMTKNGTIIAQSYNGTFPGSSNDCEDSNGNTKREVCHAEMNLIAKVAMSTQSSFGATIYTTLSPCVECAKLIIQAGILEVFYINDYRDLSPIILLRQNNVDVTKIEI